MTGLRTGFTTGTCAAAAAKAAVLALTGNVTPSAVEIPMPGGGRAVLPVEFAESGGESARAGVRKDAGDDPDVTHGMTVEVSVAWAAEESADIVFAAGEGVGTVTKKGLQLPPGEPAINPGPRKMIAAAVREATHRPVRVRISIPGGEAVALKTFNPRLGIAGGLSILGSTGIVRPYSHPALQESLKIALDVVLAGGCVTPVFTAGNIGTQAAMRLFGAAREQVVEVSNEWGFMLDCAARHTLTALLLAGHPGKLAKLAVGCWDTHSSRSGSAVPVVQAVAAQVLGRTLAESTTVEGIFTPLPPSERDRVAQELARRVRDAAAARIGNKFAVAVALTDMQGELLGGAGDVGPWRRENA